MQIYNVHNSNNESPDNSYKFPKKYEDDERLDTLGGDDPYEGGNLNDLEDEKDENMIEVKIYKKQYKNFKKKKYSSIKKIIHKLNLNNLRQIIYTFY